MDDEEVENKILEIIHEYNSNQKGITKTELSRIYAEKWGTSKNAIWDNIMDMIQTNKIELRKIKKVQKTLFIPD